MAEGCQFRLAALTNMGISLLLSVHGRSSPVTENKARGTDVNSWSPTLSFRLISDRERATINKRANSDRSSLSSTTWSASLCFTDFLAHFHVFSWTFCILAQILTSFVLIRYIFQHLSWHHNPCDDVGQVFFLIFHRVNGSSEHTLQSSNVVFLPCPDS